MPRIRISSAINGFRRAGVAHPTKPTVYDEGFFSEQQIKQLVAEPRLAVEILPDEPESEVPASPAADPQGAVEPDDVSGDLTGHVEDDDGEPPLLDDMTVVELRAIAKDKGIDGAGSLKKAELIEAILSAGGEA